MSYIVNLKNLHVWPYNFLDKVLEHSIVTSIDIDVANRLVDDILTDPQKKNIIVMRYKDNLSYAKIGDAIGITSGAVREQEHRIIRNAKHNDAIGKFMIKRYDDPKEIPLPYTSLELKECRALQRRNIKTLGDLLYYDKHSLSRMYNVGPKTIEHITDLLNEYGFSLADPE